MVLESEGWVAGGVPATPFNTARPLRGDLMTEVRAVGAETCPAASGIACKVFLEYAQRQEGLLQTPAGSNIIHRPYSNSPHVLQEGPACPH